MEYPLLFSEGKIGNLTVKNRSVMVGMEVGVAEYDGSAGERYKQYFAARAKGGVGLIISGVCRVNGKNGVAGPGQLALTSDRHIAPLKETVEEIHKYGAKFIVQLHHPGRQTLSLISTFWRPIERMGRLCGNLFWRPFFKILGKFSVETLNVPVIKYFCKHIAAPVVGASDIPAQFGGSPIHDQKTRALSRREIKKLTEQFGDAALRAKKAGADGVEVHCAHGYLLNQFLSPYTNTRTDCYGGSFENRVRIVDEIMADIRKKCGDFTVITRLNIDDCMDKIGFNNQGITQEEGVKLAKHMEEIGFEAINISCGTYETANYSIEPTGFEAGCRSHLARAVKEAVKIPTICVNLTRTPAQAEEYLSEGLFDFAGFGRPFLADPDFMRKAREGRQEDIRRCICCLWCIESVTLNEVKGAPAECALNPRCCREIDYPESPVKDGDGRLVLIAGGGPSGLTAAITLLSRGFKVIVYEKKDRLGGQLYLATLPPHKERLQWAINDLETAAKKGSAEILLNTPLTDDIIIEKKPYAVLDATGGIAVTPKIKSYEKSSVSAVEAVLENRVEIKGKKVAVIGSGMTGLETAEYIAAKGNKVTVIEMADVVAPKTWSQHTEELLPRLKKLKVEFLTGEKVIEITDEGIVLENVKTNKTSCLSADNVIMSVGVRPLGAKFSIPDGVKFIKIGDAAKTGRIANATRTAYRECLKL